MHILGAILGILAMAIAWWYRLRAAGKAANEVANQVGIVRGKIRRNALRKKAAKSPITAIDNPLIAAATLMFSTQSEEFVLGDDDEDVIRELMLQLASKDQVEEAIVYARWAIAQIVDPKLAVDKLGIFLGKHLAENEKLQFVDMLDEANARIAGCYNYVATRKRLMTKMGIGLNQ